jgi:hypothetical protein
MIIAALRIGFIKLICMITGWLSLVFVESCRKWQLFSAGHNVSIARLSLFSIHAFVVCMGPSDLNINIQRVSTAN